ncbi:hypothetical protein BDA96_07G002100 [Sorghum bicolor]|nr:hypothetical protein BDA96_07G002100 [Sorghum bicolor]
MSVVQRLTGARGATASSSLPAPPPGLTTTEPPQHHQIQLTSSSLPFPFLGGHHAHAPSSSSSAQAQLLQPAPAAPHFPFQLHQQQQAPGGPAAQHDHLMVHQLSTAARLAIEQQQQQAAADVRLGGGLLPPFPSILSPESLPAIPPSFFSPPAAPAGGNSYPYPGISLFGGLISPAFPGNETTGGGSMSIAGANHQSVTMSSSPLQEASPSTVTPSPSAGAYYWGLFNNQQH